MRLVSLQAEDGVRIGAELDGRYVDLNAADPQLPRSMRKLLALGSDGVVRASAAAQRGLKQGAVVGRPRLLAPVPDARKIICIGLNYKDHAAESGSPIPSEPILFSKYPTALNAPGQPIRLPRVSQKVDYEAELVIVIGRGGRDIPESSARQHVAGYACGHDVSARDWQLEKPGKQWMAGKTFDTFAPLGPALVTADEVPDPQNLRIALRLNGETMQDSSTSQLIFGVDYLVWYISQIVTLEPGDLIYTGTPPGVGFARKPPVFLKPGDVVEVEIERLGVLRNPVEAAWDR